MRPLALTLLTAGLLAAAVPAEDSPGAEHPPSSAPGSSDPERRARLQTYLAAFHRLSPDMQARVRRLDQALHEEDPATQARLLGVMERYAGWLARLPEADRRRVHAAAAGPERLQVVRELLDRQWRDGLPEPYRRQLAQAPDAEKANLLEKWRQEDRERHQLRLQALRTAEEATLPVRQAKFRDEAQKFVKEKLEPVLAPREKLRLARAWSGPWYGYLHTVLVLSEAHNLKPPGPAEQWERFRPPRQQK